MTERRYDPFIENRENHKPPHALIRWLLVALALGIGLGIGAVADAAAQWYRGKPPTAGIADMWARYVTPRMPAGVRVTPTATLANGYVLQQGSAYTDERDMEFFEEGTIVVITCLTSDTTNRIVACLVQDEDSVTVPDPTIQGIITDSGTANSFGSDTYGLDGTGDCWMIPPNIPRTITISTQHLDSIEKSGRHPSGARAGFCDIASGTMGYPCDADNDCIIAAGTSPASGCVAPGTTPANGVRARKGGFLIMSAEIDVNTPYCSVEIER